MRPALRRAALVLLLALALGARPLAACPTCAGEGYSAAARRAYVGITVLLSALPFAFGAFLWWQLRRAPEPEATPDIGPGAP